MNVSYISTEFLFTILMHKVQSHSNINVKKHCLKHFLLVPESADPKIYNFIYG
jgi:hypothetical protein